MPTPPNKYGLTRYVPTDVARAVRQRCKFSCIRCGDGLIQYHHFDPPFEEARTHNSAGITLLCGRCHDYARALTSQETIADLDRKRRIEAPPANVLLDLKPPFTVVLGLVILRGPDVGITAAGDDILKVESGADGVELSGQLFDDKGRLSLAFKKNVLELRPEQWDATIKGRVLTVWRERDEKVLVIRFHPPHVLHVQRIRMLAHGWWLDTTDSGRIIIRYQDRQGDLQGGLDLEEVGVVFGGPLELHAEGRLTQTGGMCISAGYSGKRARLLTSEGKFDQLLWELTAQPVVHVIASEDTWKVQYERSIWDGLGSQQAALAKARTIVSGVAYRIIIHHPDGGFDVAFIDDQAHPA